MQTLREVIAEAAARKVAVGHFNISNLEALRGIFNAARDLNLPVIIGVSEGERDFIGVHQAVALVKSLREEVNPANGGAGYPIFINADHTYSFERVKEAIDAGFDSVIVDGSKLPFAENLAMAKQAVAYARACGRDVIVEGELGYIGTSSKVLEGIPDDVDLESGLTTSEEAKRFVAESGVDMLAPAVGNIHGMLKGGSDPKLNIERVRSVAEATGVPLVLHGASGNSDEDIKAAIAAGVAVVHVNTELRVAYRDALRLSLQEHPDEVAPYKILKSAVLGVEEVAAKKLKVFNNLT
jgi:fructose-bisphosphate aldolase, class II